MYVYICIYIHICTYAYLCVCVADTIIRAFVVETSCRSAHTTILSRTSSTGICARPSFASILPPKRKSQKNWTGRQARLPKSSKTCAIASCDTPLSHQLVFCSVSVDVVTVLFSVYHTGSPQSLKRCAIVWRDSPLGHATSSALLSAPARNHSYVAVCRGLLRAVWRLLAISSVDCNHGVLHGVRRIGDDAMHTVYRLYAHSTVAVCCSVLQLVCCLHTPSAASAPHIKATQTQCRRIAVSVRELVK